MKTNNTTQNKELSLIQTIELMKRLKDQDYNNEYEIYFSNGRAIIESKIIKIVGEFK